MIWTILLFYKILPPNKSLAIIYHSTALSKTFSQDTSLYEIDRRLNFLVEYFPIEIVSNQWEDNLGNFFSPLIYLQILHMLTSNEIVQDHRFHSWETKGHINQHCFGQPYLLIPHLNNKQKRLHLKKEF